MSARTGQRAASWLIVAICALPLALIVVSSFYARPIYDDYCWKSMADAQGWLGYVTSMYTGWTGTYSALALQGVMPSAREHFVPILLWLGIGFAALFLFARALLRRFLPVAQSIELLALAATCLFLAVFLSSLPKPYEVLFWYTAMAAYGVPLLVAPLIATLILTANSPWAALPLFVLCFILAGFNPNVMALQVGLLSLGLLAARRAPRLRALILAGLLGAGLGAAVVILAPGNAVRAAELGMRPNLFEAAGKALSAAIHPLAYAAFQVPLGVIALFGLSVLCGYHFGISLAGRRLGRLYMFGVIGMTVLSVAGAFLPSFYAFSELLAMRGWATPIWVTLFGVMALGYVYGVVFRGRRAPLGYLPRRAQIVAIILALSFALNSAPILLRVVSDQAAYAAAWDERDAYLRALSGSAQTVYARSLQSILGFEDVTENPNYWTNACIASYYNLRAILPDDQLLSLPQKR